MREQDIPSPPRRLTPEEGTRTLSSHMNVSLREGLSRAIAAALSISVMAGTWDVWWHGAVGRDTFWEPPHLLLYSSAITAIGMSMYGWHRSRENVWRRLALVLLLVPLSAPFDELWHRMFGVEPVSSPLIIWSPPHVTLILATMGGFLFLLPLLSHDRDITARRFFGGCCFASAMGLGLFLTGPVEPTGANHLLGFAGAGVMSAVLVALLVISYRWMPGVLGATLTSIFFLLIQSINVGQRFLPELKVAPHEHPPRWLFLFATLLAAVSIDLLGKRLPAWVLTPVAAVVWSTVIYSFSSSFFDPQFQYLPSDAFVAVISSAIGGLFVGGLIALYDCFRPDSHAPVVPWQERSTAKGVKP